MISRSVQSFLPSLRRCVVVAAACTGLITSSARAELVGYWPFEEGSGSSTVDATGHGLDGDLLGDTTWTAGKYGGGLSFDGNGDYVEVAGNSLLEFTGNDPFSVLAWVNHDSNPGGGWKGVVVHSRDPGPWWGVWTNDGWRSGGAGNNVNGGVVETGWHHVAITSDGGGQGSAIHKIYVDGIETNMITNGGGGEGTGPLWFGGANGTGEWAKLTLDEVYVFDDELSQEAIQGIMSIPEPSTLLLLVFGAVATFGLARRQSRT